MTSTDSLVRTDPEIMGGAPVFAGTRVPIRTLFDYLSTGEPLAEFLDDFPSVTREHAEGVLRLADQAMTGYARPA